MDAIDQRLKETSDACLKAFEAWDKDKKDSTARAALQESVHELRKVASRLEIEVAISERDEMAQQPIPIPPHRDANKGNRNDNRGNRAPRDGNNDGGKPRNNQRKGPPKKAAGNED